MCAINVRSNYFHILVFADAICTCITLAMLSCSGTTPVISDKLIIWVSWLENQVCFVLFFHTFFGEERVKAFSNFDSVAYLFTINIKRMWNFWFIILFAYGFVFILPTTTTFNKMCCCMVLWVLFRAPTTTTFNKVCCCMVLWVLFRVPTTTTWACVYQQWWCRNSQEFPGITFIFNVVVVVGTRNNTHNTIQQHILLNVVVVGNIRSTTPTTTTQEIEGLPKWKKLGFPGNYSIWETSVKMLTIYRMIFTSWKDTGPYLSHAQRISTSVFINQGDRSFSNSVRAEGTLSWRSHRSHNKLNVEKYLPQNITWHHIPDLPVLWRIPTISRLDPVGGFTKQKDNFMFFDQHIFWTRPMSGEGSTYFIFWHMHGLNCVTYACTIQP